ncbi:MAG: MFS transporter [Acidimicrobiales bacterium]|nr:MFS transporter [Acidimicrobiales bacterium]
MAKGFRQAGHTPSLAAALIHFDVSFLCWVLVGALGPYIADDLGLTSTQKGLMVAIPPLGGAAFRLLLGPLSDRVGIKRLGLITLGLTFVPLAWGATLATTYAQVLGVGLLLGVAGASFAVALPLASRWYPPEHQGLALGIAGAGNSGTVIAALAAPRLAEHVGWQGTFALAMVPVALAWIAFAVLAKEPPRPVDGPPPGGSLSLLREQDPRWLCAFYMVSFGGFVGLSGYLPIFFVDRFGLTKVAAGGFAALCAVAGSLLRPVGGALADRLGGTRVLAAVLVVAGCLVAILATLPPLGLTVALLFSVLGLLGMGNGAVFQLVGRRVPERVGAMTGLVGAAGGLGGFVLPFGFGALAASTGGFTMGFAVLAGTIGLASLAAASRDRVWSIAPRPGLVEAVA